MRSLDSPLRTIKKSVVGGQELLFACHTVTIRQLTQAT